MSQPRQLDPLTEKLVEALVAARDHLDFCGYGDTYEREAALKLRKPPLDEEIREALRAAGRY